MKITYPNMGNLSISIKSILGQLGFQVIPPPPISKSSANIGTKLAPEGACYPFKLVLGNVIEGLNKGADTVIMIGGGGPCRFGYFGNLMAEIIKDAGYSAKFIILEGDGILQQVNSLRHTARAGWIDVYKALMVGWKKTATADYLESLANELRPLEVEQGAISKILKQTMVSLDEVSEIREVNLLKEGFTRKLENVIDRKRPPLIKLGLVGDIYMLIEPYANCQIETMLGGLGVSVTRSMYISSWIKQHFGTMFSWIYQKGLIQDSLPYLQDFVGGHGLDTIANTIRYHRDGYDGIVHILPMTCMPEIVAQSVTPKVREELGVPVLTLVLDEHSGHAGLQSRVEAYIDVLIRKKLGSMQENKVVGKDIYITKRR